MGWGSQLVGIWRSALAGGLLCSAVGLILLWWGGWPVFLGYDLLFLFRHGPPPDDVVIVYMDDKAFQELGQTSTPSWNRNLHAELLDRLTDDQSGPVIFDVVFSEPGTPEANTNLTRAIARHGRVILAAALNHPSRAQIQVKQPLLPLPEFLDAAAGWGLAEVDMGSSPGRTARKYYTGTTHQPSLPWAAAAVARPGVTRQLEPRQPDRWLNYYGPALSLPHVRYSEVPDLPSGWFSNKTVFIGALPTTLRAWEEADQFRTPHTLWTGEYTPGVEIGATAFLNLLREDGLRRWAAPKEALLIALAGFLLGAALCSARPRTGGAAALLGVALLLILALQAAKHQAWFSWTIILLAQIPTALAWSLRCHFHRLRFEKAVLERTLVQTSRSTPSPADNPRQTGLVIPDHTLVRSVGKGAYGEVWLARNTIGLYHAVKVVKRQAFSNDQPYEREFRGIQNYMPVSRSHPGLVHLLHVGRNDASGFFFVIMEAADDQKSGRRIDPEAYSPKTLAAELLRRGKLEPEECLDLGMCLALALEHLHQQRLVHRDIKPANIIHVNAAPKLADIGLVAEQRENPRDLSLVGTEGYVPPEGPGSPSADVYALGKVLYESAFGRDRQLFPEVPTTLWEEPEHSLPRRLNQVIGKACHPMAEARYRSAAELHAALLNLKK